MPIARRAARIAVVALLASCALPGTAAAGPANRTPFTVTQPNGTTFQARAVGDEWSNATETLDGFTIVREPASGAWVYAEKAPSGLLRATALVVGRDAPLGLRRGIRPDRPQFAPALEPLAPQAAPVLGTLKTLVILVQFANKAGSTTASAWQSKFFGATDSVKDHYAVSSYNQVTIAAGAESHGTSSDGIVGWLTLGTNHPNTAGSTGTANQQLTKDAILAADPYVNFSSFDTNGNGRISPDELMVIVIAAGNETSYGGAAGACSPSVWGHRWSIFSVTPPTVDGKVVGGDGYAQFGEMHCSTSNPPGQMATIGIMAHEVGHLGFGLPDLYDTDGSSAGVGQWSLMAGGSWNTLSRSGDSPSLLDAWSRARLGWVTPTAVTSTPTSRSIPAVETSSVVFQFLAGSALNGTGEYFLLENRQKTSYDAALPGSGLLIWHIDEGRPNNASECIPGGTPACTATVHYKVTLIQADNLFHLEQNVNRGDAGDPFPGTGGKSSFTNLTSPNSKLWSGAASNVNVTSISASAATMTATLSVSAASPPGAFNKSLPTNGATGQSTGPTLSWGASANATSYEYCIDTTNDSACSSWTGNAAATSVVLAGLAGSTPYYWQVRANNSGGTTYGNGSSTAFWGFTTSAVVSGDAFEPDNTPAQAPLIASGATQSHTFHLGTDVDWIRFSATIGHQYTLYTSNLASGVNTVLYLYDSNGTTLLVSDDDSGGGLSSQIVYAATATATLYAKVLQSNQINTGSYLVTLIDNGIAGDLYEPDNTAAQAKTLTVGTTQPHTFHVNGDADWLRFAATPGLQYTITTSNLVGVDTVLYLYASDGTTLLASDDNGGGGANSRIVYTAVSSTNLYVRAIQFGGTGIGSYLLGLTSTTAPGDAYEPDNAFGQASVFSIGGTQSHTFHIDGDVDWARFTATAGQQFTITTSGLGPNVDTVLYLYASDGATLLTFDDDGGGSLSSRIVYTAVASGNLYAQVVRFGGTGTGNYVLGLTAADAGDAYEVDNTAAQASLISVGVTQAHTFHIDGDVDWASFSAVSGQKYTISTSGLGPAVDTVLYLYAADGTTLLATNDDIGGGFFGSRIFYTATATGTLYINVVQYGSLGTGDYLLQLLGGGTYFYDDMENGVREWTMNPPWALTQEFAHSGTHAWSDSPFNTYGADVNAVLFSPVIDLTGAVVPQLTFWHRRDVVNDGDVAAVWISIDGGFSWVELANFTGTSTTWTPSTTSLTPYAGEASVMLAFQLFSDSSGFGDGWYIDDVVVREAASGSVTITSPTSGPTYSTANPVLNLAGTASGGASLATCSNPAWGPDVMVPSSVGPGWACTVGVVLGVNVVTVTSDVGGSATLTVTYSPTGWSVSSNQAAIEIPVNSASQSSGVASPYPSTVVVAGLVGTVQRVVVRLSGFSHTYPSDVSFALVGPGGQAFAFMDRLGGGTGVTGLSLIFDDAAGSVPGSALARGTYRPSSSGYGSTFPAPGPATFGIPAPSGSATFASVFGGTNPNGTWSLYVVDMAGGDIGAVPGGWSLGIVTTTPVTPRLTDLNGDGNGDAFVYDPATGGWGRELAAVGGGFQETGGGWAAGWSIQPADFNGDAQTDMFVFSTTTGQWYKLLGTGSGFSTQATGFWWPGWQRYVLDLDGDGISDLFVYDPASGQWYKCFSTPTGFTYASGWWAPGWELHPMNLNGDAYDDLFLISRTTGQWYWVLGASGSGFTYPQSSWWAPDWSFTPGDFNNDGLTDLLLYRSTTGEYYVAITTGTGFTYTSGWWAPGWTPAVLDLDGDERADVFVYNKTTGQWYELIGDGAGLFTVVGSGFWGPGWDLYPTDFNNDDRVDLLVYNPVTGAWYQAWNLNLGSFAYYGGYWQPGLTIIAGPIWR